jgi:hypothetical protein
LNQVMVNCHCKSIHFLHCLLHSSFPISVDNEPFSSPMVASDNDGSDNGNEDAVMNKAIQDPGLYKIYTGLPRLKCVFPQTVNNNSPFTCCQGVCVMSNRLRRPLVCQSTEFLSRAYVKFFQSLYLSMFTLLIVCCHIVQVTCID